MRILLLLALLAAPAHAGTRATYQGRDGRTIVIEVADGGDARVSTPGQGDYGVLSGGAFHVVGSDGGRPTVARVADLREAMTRVLPSPLRAGLADTPAPPAAVAAGEEAVAGRRGARFVAPGEDAERALVVSRDPALAEVGRALEGFTIAALLPLLATMPPGTPPPLAEVRARFALGTPLRTPAGLTLVKVEAVEVPAERVRLPAVPLAVEALVARMRGVGKR